MNFYAAERQVIKGDLRHALDRRVLPATLRAFK
jgi:hypothetical protein